VEEERRRVTPASLYIQCFLWVTNDAAEIDREIKWWNWRRTSGLGKRRDRKQFLPPPPVESAEAG
jgi:hypothetical protein